MEKKAQYNNQERETQRRPYNQKQEGPIREELITLLLCLQRFEANCFHIEHPDAVVST